MATPGTYEALRSAKTIGVANLAAWSAGFNPSDYLNVLPNPGQRLPMNDAWSQWQRANQLHSIGVYSGSSANGSYYSSWGPQKELNLTLDMSSYDSQTIQGLGRIMADPTGGQFYSAYPTSFWRYNDQVAGPLLVANPGDTINIKLKNNLKKDLVIEQNPYARESNLHGHGLQVSPGGNSDNVLMTVKPGETWDVTWALPDSHFNGLYWVHPHYHGSTSLAIAKGLALPLLVLPESAAAWGAYDPTRQPVFQLGLQTQALAQQERPASPSDPLNQDPKGTSWPIGTPPRTFTDATGSYYKYSPGRFNGNNYYPVDGYSPTNPIKYGDGVGLMPNENVIHTVNGYYNPTLEVKTGQWATFFLENFSLNSTHIIQLVRRDAFGRLSLERPTLLGTDGDLSNWVAGKTSTQLPLLIPGGRVGIQHAFTKPGEYYIITNASKEVLGDLAPVQSNLPQGNGSTYLGFNDGFQITPSQVLATVRVSGPAQLSAPPKPWASLYGQYAESQQLRTDVSLNGVDKEREFVWNTGALPPDPNFSQPQNWEKTWTINGQYWSHSADLQPTLTTSMLDTVERWKLKNTSKGRLAKNSSGTPTYNVVGQSHPFHIHTNEFLVESVNGLAVSSDQRLNQAGDTILSTYLDNFLLGPRYIQGTASASNPYGMPWSDDKQGKAADFQANLLLQFKDFPGMFVDHCHLLFHEDAGMMVPVQIILNTNASWLVADSTSNRDSIQISLASNLAQALQFSPYASGNLPGAAGINVSSGDVNANPATFQSGRNGQTSNVTDNIEDVVTLQKSLASTTDRFVINIYDGAPLQRSAAAGVAAAPSPLWTIAPFTSVTAASTGITDLAVGDINGDGFSDIAASLGSSNLAGLVEIYSGKDRKLLASLLPFAGTNEKTAINLSVGDINADGFADIVVAQGEGGSGRVEAFSGINLYKQLEASAGDPLTGLSATQQASMFDEPFKPYGDAYRGSVDVAASYILPRGFTTGQVHQTPSANITTLQVGASGSASNPSIRNFLYLGPVDHSKGHQSAVSPAGLNATLPVNVTYTSGYSTSQPYVKLESQYLDLSTTQRGVSTLLATTAAGRQDVLYLPDTSMQSGDLKTFESTVLQWNPTLLA